MTNHVLCILPWIYVYSTCNGTVLPKEKSYFTKIMKWCCILNCSFFSHNYIQYVSKIEIEIHRHKMNVYIYLIHTFIPSHKCIIQIEKLACALSSVP